MLSLLSPLSTPRTRWYSVHPRLLKSSRSCMFQWTWFNPFFFFTLFSFSQLSLTSVDLAPVQSLPFFLSLYFSTHFLFFPLHFFLPLHFFHPSVFILIPSFFQKISSEYEGTVCVDCYYMKKMSTPSSLNQEITKG